VKVHSFFDLDDAIRYARKAQKGVEAKRIRLPQGKLSNWIAETVHHFLFFPASKPTQKKRRSFERACSQNAITIRRLTCASIDAG